MNSSVLSAISIGVSFLLASMLNVYPLSFDLASYRPMTLLLVLIFWAMYQPRTVGITMAFFVGLFSDLLLDTHLGHQAFCAVSMVFLLRLATNYAKRLDFISSWILAGGALLVYRLLLWVFEMFTHDNFAWTGFLSVITSIACYPMVHWALIKLHNKIQHIYDNR